MKICSYGFWRSDFEKVAGLSCNYCNSSQNHKEEPPPQPPHQCLSVWSLCILLYGAEFWVTYQPQESKLSAFHSFNVRFILGITWRDKMTNEKFFRITGFSHFSARLKFIRLCWAGHVIRIFFYTEFPDFFCMVCWRKRHTLKGSGSGAKMSRKMIWKTWILNLSLGFLSLNIAGWSPQ